MEQFETQQLIDACERCSQTIPSEALKSLLLTVAFRLKELQNENSKLISLSLEHGIIKRDEPQPDNIIQFPQKSEKK